MTELEKKAEELKNCKKDLKGFTEIISKMGDKDLAGADLEILETAGQYAKHILKLQNEIRKTKIVEPTGYHL